MVMMTPDAARAYWRALLTNAASLIRDAHRLYDAGSFGRVRALAVLAEEELGKATAVYEKFSHAWTEGQTEARDLPTTNARVHLTKYAAAYEFGRELSSFWGGSYEDAYPADDEDWSAWYAAQRRQAEEAARVANVEKQRGFYVDLDGDRVLTPERFTADDVGDELVRAAQVIEMMLIKDHTRMQSGDPARFDPTYDLQWMVMPTSHGEEFANFARRMAEGEVEGQPPQTDQ